jgi:hypothetical protein
LGRPLITPELESMNVLFRLQRYGIAVPRLLAAGQKYVRPWQMESFLLTESTQNGLSLAGYVAKAAPPRRRTALRQAALLMRQMHHANCYLDDDRRETVEGLLNVCCVSPTKPTVGLATVQGIEKSHYPNSVRGQLDLAALVRHLGATCSRSDLLCGLLAYLAVERLTPAARMFAGKVLRRVRQPRRRSAA